LPTNVDSVKNALLEEVSRGNREVINELKKLIEPQTKKMKALTDEYKMLGERKDNPEEPNKREIYARRRQIHDEIARIKREIEKNFGGILEEIKTKERVDARYRSRNHLLPLPRDDVMDADIEMEKVDDAAGVFGRVLDKKAVNAEVELRGQSRIAQTNQDLIDAMSRMSVHPGSPRSDSSARGSPPSTPRSGSLARGSTARGSPLPPPHGLPSGRRARDSSARGSRRSPSP
jgi:hypothetical protein